ncbi:MAG: S9 family peptidase [Planctomycetes bacterium]|nr:S9 family peptidase [Planctomycetota bacterium]
MPTRDKNALNPPVPIEPAAKRDSRRRWAAALLAAICFALPAVAQDEPPATASAPQSAAGQALLSFEAIHGPGSVDFDGSYARGMSWLPDGQHFLHRRGNTLQRVDALTDESEPAYDHERLQQALEQSGDFNKRSAERFANRPGTHNRERTAVLIQHRNRLYLYRYAEAELTRLSAVRTQRRAVALSPRAGFVGFVRENNLYTIDAASGTQHQLTGDGSDTLLNGVLDWVYQEEVYGRGDWNAHWWRDDDAFVAYLQLDESQVPLYTIVDQTQLHPEPEQARYPKAGDPNPTVRLGVVRPTGGDTVWVDLAPYADIDFLVVRVGWAPDGQLIYQVQDREARWLDLNEANPTTGRSRRLLRETSPAWVDFFGQPHWLDDGSFLWLSARDGWRHIYHYARDGQLIRRVTGGAWEVRSLHGHDPQTGCVYFSGTRDTPIESHAYRVKLAGGPTERLTTPGFSHSTDFDPTFRFFIDTFSNITTPTKVHLRGSDGALVREISENEVPALADYRLATPEFVRIPARDGYVMNALLIRPPELEAGRKYPVFMETYAGPHAPSVHNRWGGRGLMVQHMLAQEGYIVYVCDPRSASGQGDISAWQAYRRLGVSEVADLEDHIRWLGQLDYVDTDRVGLDGYSYGGFMVQYALTHSRMFRMGVAGASLSDWRNYDSIYTERYMQTPQNNPGGYDRTSVNRAAGNLHGRLLIVHGVLDDNVHFQSTLQFIHELQQAGKTFDLMIYPRDRHGLGHGWRHFVNMRLDYIRNNL